MYVGTKDEEEAYQTLIDIGTRAGIKTITAKVYAYLFLEPNTLSLEELAEKTGYSLASVSNAVKELELFKKVRRIKEPGSKKVYVQGEKNFIQTIHQQFKHMIESGLIPLQEVLPTTIKNLKKTLKTSKTKKEKEIIKEKIRWYEDYLEQNKEIITLFSTMETSFRKIDEAHEGIRP